MRYYNLCSTLLGLCILTSFANAQFGFGGPKGPEPKAVRSDVQYIRCEVCQQLAKQAYRQAAAFKKEAAQKKAKHERKASLSPTSTIFLAWSYIHYEER